MMKLIAHIVAAVAAIIFTGAIVYKNTTVEVEKKNGEKRVFKLDEFIKKAVGGNIKKK